MMRFAHFRLSYHLAHFLGSRSVQSNSRTVTLEYNSVLTDYKTVVKTAEQEARKYGKQAVVRGVINERRKTQWGSIDTIVFDLVD